MSTYKPPSHGRTLASLSLLSAILTAAICAAFPGCAAASPPPSATSVERSHVAGSNVLAADEDAAIEEAVREIERIANEVANSRAYFDPDLRPIPVSASYARHEGLLYLHFEERLGPEAGYTEMVDLGLEIGMRIEEFTKHLPGYRWTEDRFGGYDAGRWLEGAQQLPSRIFPLDRQRTKREEPMEPSPLLVAGGHGFFYHYGQKRWTSHRDPVNGLLEDEVAQVLADSLAAHLSIRRIPVENVRRLKEGPLEAEGKPDWWKLGARYHLEAKAPQLVHVWNSQPDDKANDRERRQDIRSRPLYANYLGSPAVLHVHTNASSGTATGARTYVFPGRPDDKRLADLILCGMRELIHSADEFSDYYVPLATNLEVRHGENRLAKVPSVIVEVGFHTNPSDAAHLLNPSFQSLAMKGVAKGYQLFRDKRSCQPFTIPGDQAIEHVVWGRAKLPVSLEGNPDYPVTVWAKKMDCDDCKADRGWLWTPAEVAAYTIQHACRPPDIDQSPIRYSVWATDSSDVKSNTVTYSFTCKPRASVRAPPRAAS
jgi:hypothetical protein